MRRTLSRPLLASFAASVLLAACGGSGTTAVDSSTIVGPVTARANELGVRVAALDCPTGVEARAGAQFTCTLRTDRGETVPVTVTQKDQNGQITLAWQLGPDLVVPETFIGDLTAHARSKVSGDLTVSCPKAVVLPGGNGTLRCTVRDPSGAEGALVVPVEGGRPVADRARWSIEQ